ncbi:DUF512 domain-containing protein [Helicovermis profundi]|uniref:DUF512 domain-containing protein n=1 Tax=Helicovermis profundi TaxID=3065157 RepID=A0AAU9E5Y0_9FIRM|nr:DUF512 domain-containing protein [Clostridia bacterium S502]
MKNLSNVISKIMNESIAEELGLNVGDALVSINGKKVVDIIDYLFLMSDEFLEVEIEKKNGEIWMLEIDKEYDEELGIEFENPILDHAKRCSNNCMFCFVDQLPPNMRETLYFKDDDSRLSFLQGNFVTLTNVKDEELDRIIDYNISPINVSIHTTNSELRKKMLSNKFAGNVIERLNKLTENRVEVNGQIVLCPDINDKDELDRTLNDLLNMKRPINSLAIVPVGKTKFREGLYLLNTFNKESALFVIEQIEKWQKKFMDKIGTRFVFLSDEFYVLAGIETPNYESYEGFTLIENGVGLIRKFKYEVDKFIENDNSKDSINLKRCITISTGKSAYKFLNELAKDIMKHYNNIKINVFEVKNSFFGESITVAGLLTGQDIYNRLKNEELGDMILLPKAMMKSDENIFLDDMTVDELSKKLNISIKITNVIGKEFMDNILGNKAEVVQ